MGKDPMDSWTFSKKTKRFKNVQKCQKVITKWQIFQKSSRQNSFDIFENFEHF